MITIMSSPLVLQGQAEPVSPTRIASPAANAAHKFFLVVYDLISKAAYHSEAQKWEAEQAVRAYERQVISAGDLRQVSSDNDRAPVEDVSKRRGPNVGQPQPVLPPGLDMEQLARALAVYMASQAQANPPVVNG